MEGFFLVKYILRDVLSLERITYRDVINYFSVLVDDNNRKPICRFYFDQEPKRLVLLDKDKNQIKYDINSIHDIFNFSDQLVEAAELYK